MFETRQHFSSLVNMAISNSTLVLYVTINIGFLYFFVGVSNNYFNRDVISETLIELQSELDFPTVSFCFDLVITMTKFNFSGDEDSDYSATKGPAYSKSCQNDFALTVNGRTPRGSGLYQCPWQEFNKSFDEHLIEPYVSNLEFFDINVHYTMFNGSVVSEDQSVLNISRNEYYQDGLRCYDFTLSGEKKNIPSKVLSIRTPLERGDDFRRFTVRPAHHVPCSVDYTSGTEYFQFHYKFSRVNVNTLPYPFAANCRNYLPRYHSRDHCLDSCVKALAPEEMFKSIPYSSAEITTRKFSVSTPSSRIITHCTERCAQSNCHNEFYYITTDNTERIDARTRLSYDVELYAINEIPKTSLVVFIIYIGDLLAAFYGVCVLTQTYVFLKYACRLKYCCATWKTFRTRYRRFSRYILRRFALAISLAGLFYQGTICMFSYLEYGTISETLFENAEHHVSPNLAVCLAYYQKQGYLKLSYNESVIAFPSLSRMVDRISVFNSVTGESSVYNSSNNITQLSVGKYMMDQNRCHVLKFGQIYRTSDFRNTRQYPVKVNLNASSLIREYKAYGMFLSLHGKYIEMINSSFQAAHLITSEYLSEYVWKLHQVKLSRRLLPYPYTNCFDGDEHSFTMKEDCKARCFSQLFTNSSYYHSHALFVDKMPLQYYDARPLTAKEEYYRQKSHCSGKCNLNYCVKDVIIHQTPRIFERPAGRIPYNVLIEPIPITSTYTTMSPQMALSDLIVYISGILGVWFGVNCSSLTISVCKTINFTISRLRQISIYAIHLVLISAFFVQLKILIVRYTSYETVMQISIAYPTLLKPPSVSLCFNTCPLLNTNYEKCMETFNNFTTEHLAGVNSFVRLIDALATRNPITMRWDYVETPNRLLHSLPRYLANFEIIRVPDLCFVYKPKESQAYDITKARLANKLSWFKVGIARAFHQRVEASHLGFKFRVHHRDFRFEDEFRLRHPASKRPYCFFDMYTGNATFQSVCKVWDYKSLLLPYPYNTNCFDYTLTGHTSQANCYRSCLQKHKNLKHDSTTVPRIETHDLRYPYLENFIVNTTLQTRQNKCIKKCSRRDCTLYFSFFAVEELVSDPDPNENIPSLYLDTKLYETKYQPQMSFSEFIIYLLTYLGILLGIDALVIKPILDQFICCR